MGTFLQQASPSDFDQWETHLANGIEPATAAKLVADHLTSSAFKRANRTRHAEAIAMGREARGYVVDRLIEDDVLIRDDAGAPVAYRDDASDAMKQFHARRWQPAYANQQLEVTGGVDVRTDIAAAIDRFTETVAAAAVRAAAGDGTELAAGESVGRGEGAVGVAVDGVAGPA